VELYWSNTPEFAEDPSLNNKRDFEGYRIYGSPKTDTPEGEAPGEWTLLADYDLDFDLDPTDDDSSLVGYNIGMGQIHLDSLVNRGIFTQAQVDSMRDAVRERTGLQNVSYRWVNSDLKNGWPRDLYYAVTSYDKGDETINLPSLESARVANRTYAYPGTRPVAAGDDRVSVYPNPYYGRAAWDGLTGRDRLIWFRYLPANAEVRIFTLAGEEVDRFQHHAATYDGSDVNRITAGAAAGERRAFAGGEHAWDLLTEEDQEVATGLYIYTVEDLDTGDVKTGKFLVIK
jgi:hypothetical protein